MQVTSTKLPSSLAPELKRLVDSPRYLSVWSKDLDASIPVRADAVAGVAGQWQLSSRPPGAVLGTHVAGSDVDWEGTRKLVKETFLPMLGMAGPEFGRLVAGVSFAFALEDLVEAYSKEAGDATRRHLVTAEATQKGVDLLLGLLQAPPLAQNLNAVAGIVIDVADDLYVIQASGVPAQKPE